MSGRSTALIVALILTFAALGSASIIPKPGDPDIVVDAGGLSQPLTAGTNFPGGTGSFDYYNPFALPIISLTFEIDIAKNLDFSDPSVSSLFNCSSDSFSTCGFNYTAPSGVLDILFSGAPGIPPLLPGCLADPDGFLPSGVDCTSQGHFHIDITGWDNTDSPGLFDANNPNPGFGVVEVDLTPEPSTSVLIGSMLLAGVALLRRRAASVKQ